MFTEADHQHMSRALELAALGMWSTTPNPRVGCVIVRDRQVVGEGWHRRAGEPHAEVLALAQANGAARGATVYLTLEPCSHHGRTPPCVDALLEARVGRVVVAMEDPNPLVSGRGLAKLREAGVDVRCGLLGNEARELNIGFVSRMTRQRPWVRMKIAASLDGRTALPDGRSQWITGPAARDDGHAWRARACAVLTGIGTVKDDDPRLTVRAVDTPRQPLRVLVDSRLEVGLDANIVRGGNLLVACARSIPAKVDELKDRGCEVVEITNAQGKVDLPALLRELAARGVNELHVEAGHRLNGSLLREDCVDELLVYLAPVLLGNATGMAELMPPAELEAARRLEFRAVDRVGDDVRLLARLPDRLPAAPTGGAAELHPNS
ncbi:bifunctional diaminohydroxyphosphoribosylaminopyrimidine deaminase/5-amino-6-(5-phosphoribosylamino)uracil reductase RibD [Burkholderiaceae bacterium FT117]|uniref:bifunctional diaminohydroxyphosphoribosylaminopyrimidine deaminase/5-amino-6-(5-phosphoribosylamino)uracil reductase RibD n=1 Tax=Zeimonas sediminis TaxID=2944268 RepID=UPI0023430E07|nr:bifunctional diaminohydroxyphosphoribosylaminopyrimidine deaminase/5-amino-6-(5-phosphoribosylamino)uracil reductase RibD [Zeimonas sediminis]MCM5572419.1 bifunctional diaminohydroxyphosphoribosylaminopyrimidine deaminase/5-amino-6-(5-phosphoribosylamino)uracil reductase RibD [Zeimonas sediminis]